jgi:hypothetical protein
MKRERVRVFGPRDPTPAGYEIINVTSGSFDFGRALSPFLLGPCELYAGYHSRNMENAWQYAKVYQQHLDERGEPSRDYWEWARSGWSKQRADRYPMGKGAIPEFSFWNGEKLGYIEARKQIYAPLYITAVDGTAALRALFDILARQPVALFDYDGYDHVKRGMSLADVLNDPTRKMGHAFVLAAILSGGWK